MTLRNVPKGYTLEQQRQEINLIAADLDTAVDGEQTFGGNKEFTGDVTFAANVYFGDNDKLIFGDDNDLQIFYDGTFSRIWETGENGLEIRTNQFFLTSQDGVENIIRATENASVELFYDNSKRIETTTSGVTVTGSVLVDNNLYVNSGYPGIGAQILETGAYRARVDDVASVVQDALVLGRFQNLDSFVVKADGNVSTIGDVTAASFIGSVSGNADTATALETARTIGGVSFDGTADIDLPGVNTSGSQDTSGNAATATALQTARNIAGQSFDGTADITIAATDLSDTDQALATTSNVSFNTVSTDEINSDSFSIKNAAGNQTLASFTPSGGFSLWHSGAIALNSSGSGVTVNDKLTVNTTSGLTSTILAQFSNTDASATPLGIGGLTQSDTRVYIQSAADSGGNPHIRFKSGGTDHVVGQLYAGTTNNKLVLGAGNDPTLATGITIDGLGNVAANNLSFSSQSSGAGLTSEYLDHYEEGTWTPVVKSGANTITFTGGNQAFTYTKIGDTVHVYFAVDGSTSSGTTGGFWTIEGLPFPALSTTGYASVGSIIWDSTGLTGDSWPAVPHVAAGSTTLNVYAKTSAASSYSSVNINQVGAGDSIFFSLTYKTNS